MRYCPAAGGDGKRSEGGHTHATRLSLGGATVQPRPAAPGEGAGGQRRLCPALPLPPRYRRPGVSPCPGPLTGSGCPARSEAVPLLFVSLSSPGRRRCGRPAGGRGAVRRDAPAVRVRRRLLRRSGGLAAACFPSGRPPPPLFFFSPHYYSFNFYRYLAGMGFAATVFVGGGKRGSAAGGAPRLVCAGSVVAQPWPSQDSRRSRREPCPGHPCPPGRWGGNLGRGMQRGGLCGCGLAGLPLPR